MALKKKIYDFDELIPRQGTNSIKWDLRKTYFGREDVIPMWVADMDFRTPDFVIDALRSRLEHEILGYTFRSDRFRESIQNWMQQRHGWNIQQSWINYCPGVVPAISLLIQTFTRPGDKIIVQPPVYFPFFSAIEKNDRIIAENPLKLINGRLCMDFDDLRQKARDAAMLLLCHPHNPGGSVWTRNELETLASICLEHQVLIVSDEIHSDLIYPPYQHIPIAMLSEEIARQTITCNAPTKTFNLAGVPSAYVIIPDAEKKKQFDYVLKERFQLHLGHIFGALALESAYTFGEDWLDQLLQYLAENVRVVMNFFEQNLPHIQPLAPQATYLIWIDFRQTGLTQQELHELLVYKAGVGLSNGSQFGTGGEGFMRMNIACPRSLLLQALERIRLAFSTL